MTRMDADSDAECIDLSTAYCCGTVCRISRRDRLVLTRLFRKVRDTRTVCSSSVTELYVTASSSEKRQRAHAGGIRSGTALFRFPRAAKTLEMSSNSTTHSCLSTSTVASMVLVPGTVERTHTRCQVRYGRCLYRTSTSRTGVPVCERNHFV
jgi:hypothetical protein